MIDLKKTYDAIVVGSGAAGGMAAKELTEGGLQVLLLEAGPRLDPARGLPHASLALRDAVSRF